jgi:hypothetical protein
MLYRISITHRISLIVLICLAGVLLPAPSATLRAAPAHYGYLWNLVFDFDHNFEGLMTIEVGPWQDGNLLAVEETSKVRVHCEPKGDVKLYDGAAIFANNGYLVCTMNIGEAVRTNHGLAPNNPDTYGSIVMRSRAAIGVEGIAPIFAHPDAQYSLVAGVAPVLTMSTDLSNGNGPMETVFTSGVTWHDWTTYTANYVCNAVCDLSHSAGALNQLLNNQGAPVQFATDPTTFYIGHDGSAFLTGRIDSLLIDPGNFAH